MFVGMLVGYTIVFAMIALVSSNVELKRRYYLWAKVLNSTAFMVIFFLSVYISGDVYSFWLMLPAFFCCFVGDIFMAMYHRQRKRLNFLLGLFLFLAGHLCFIRWLCSIQKITVADLLIPVLGVLIAWKLMARKDIHTGRLKPFILLYTFFVALFFVKGQHLAICHPMASYIMVAIGSALFLASDISILFLYFQKRKGPAVHIFNLATYYYAMFLLASHLLFL